MKTTTKDAKKFLRKATEKVYQVGEVTASENRDMHTFTLDDLGFELIISRRLFRLDGDKAPRPYLAVSLYQVREDAVNVVKMRFPGRPFIALLEDIIQAVMPKTFLVTMLGSRKGNIFNFLYEDQGVIAYDQVEEAAETTEEVK